MTVCPEEESILMTSFVDTLARLHGKEGESVHVNLVFMHMYIHVHLYIV